MVIYAISILKHVEVHFQLIAYHLELDSRVAYTYTLCGCYGYRCYHSAYSGIPFDRYSTAVLMPLVGILIASLSLFYEYLYVIIGIVLRGAVMSMEESVMHAYIANAVDARVIVSSYGIFSLFYGISWFIGNVVIGILYDLMLLLYYSLWLQSV